MKKLPILLVLIAILVAALCLASCGSIHDYAVEWSYDENTHWHACNDEGCDKIYKQGAHTMAEEAEKYIAPTEAQVGKRYEHCTVCGYEVETEIPVLQHNPKEEWATDETDHWHECQNEGCTDQLDKAAHEFVDTTEKDVEPTEETIGKDYKVCSVCGYETYDEIPVIVHDFSEEWTTDETDHWHICLVEGCNKVADKGAHEFERTPEKDVAPTEAETGKSYKACSVCGYETFDEVPKLEHDISEEWVTDETDHWHICLNEGCEEIFDKTAHEYIDTTEKDIPATEETTGKDYKICGVCGYETFDEIPKIVHEFPDEWTSDETNHWHACSVEGCDKIIDQEEHTFEWVIDKVVNYLEDGLQHEECTVCGYCKEGVVIEKKEQEIPTYTVPTGLAATYGDTLQSITLPQGFSFEDDKTTPVGDAGENQFTVKYKVPGDNEQRYKIMTGIVVTVSVQQAQGYVKNISSLAKLYDGNPMAEPTYEKLGDGTVTVVWYKGETELAQAPTDAGDYSVKITLADGKNYIGATASKVFTISRIKGSLDGVTVNGKTYDGDPMEDSAVSGAIGGGTVTVAWLDTDHNVISAPTNAGRYFVKVSSANATNYVDEDVILPFEITKAAVTISTLPTQSSTNYIGQQLSGVALTGGSGSVSGSFRFVTPTDKITGTSQLAEVEFVPDDSTNYGTATEEILLTANQLTITASAGENGTVSPIGTVNVDYGSGKTFTFTPEEDYTVETVKVNGASVTVAGSYTFTDIVASATLHVTFYTKLEKYDVTVNKTGEGTISNGSAEVLHGRSFSTTITAAEGYYISALNINGEEKFAAIVGDKTSESLTITVITNNTINVTFSPIPVLTVSAATNGSLDKTTGSHSYGSSVSVKATPNSGYYLVSFTVDGVEQMGTTFTDYESYANGATVEITMTADTTVEAQFAANPQVTFTATGNGSKPDDTTSTYGDTKQFTFTAQKDNHIVSVSVDGVEKTDARGKVSFTFTLSEIVDDVAVEVEYAINPKITAVVTGGSVNSAADNSGDDYADGVYIAYDSDSQVTLYIIPAANKHLYSLKIADGEELVGTDGYNSVSEYNICATITGFANLTSDVTIYVEFADNPVVTASSDTNGSIQADGEAFTTKYVSYTDSITVKPVPNTGYQLDSFTVDGEDKMSEIGQNGEYVLTNVTADIAVAATFRIINFQITLPSEEVQSKNGYTMSVDNDNPDYGTNVVLTFTPAATHNRATNYKVVFNDGTEKQIAASQFVNGCYTFASVTHDIEVVEVVDLPVNQNRVGLSARSELEIVGAVMGSISSISQTDATQTATTNFSFKNTGSTIANVYGGSYTVKFKLSEKAQGLVKVMGVYRTENDCIANRNSILSTLTVEDGYYIIEDSFAQGNTSDQIYYVKTARIQCDLSVLGTGTGTVQISCPSTTTVSGQDVTLSIGSTVKIYAGEKVTMTIDVRSGYMSSVKLNGVEQMQKARIDGTKYTIDFDMTGEGNKVLRISFAEEQVFVVNYNVVGSGHVEGGNFAIVTKNNSLTFTAVPDEGYATRICLSDGTMINADTYTFASVTANIEVTIYFYETTVTEIATEEEFFAIANNPNGNFKLTDDIVLSQGWTPIDFFAGVLDGDGHTVSGIELTGATDEKLLGLFRRIEGAKIFDLTLDATVACGKNIGHDYVAILAAQAVGSVIEGVTVGGQISSTGQNTATTVGSLIGYALRSEISDCHSTASFNGGWQNAGGLLGAMENSQISGSSYNGTLELSYVHSVGGFAHLVTNSTVTASTATAEIEGTVTGSTAMTQYGFVGGFAGKSVCSTITRSVSNATINVDVVDNVYTAGFVAVMETGTASYSYATGSVTARGAFGSNSSTAAKECGAAGFVGRIIGAARITECYTTASISVVVTQACSYRLLVVGGFVGEFPSATGLTIERCFAANSASVTQTMGASVSGVMYGGFAGRGMSLPAASRNTYVNTVQLATNIYGTENTNIGTSQTEENIKLQTVNGFNTTYWNFEEGQFPTLK